MRRLPVYVLIDCSHSMRGEPIETVHSGLQRMVDDLCSDPFALETVWLSVITFSTGAERPLPLTEIMDVRVPELSAKGRTEMGAGLRLLTECIDSEVRRASETEKGDWKPIAFLLSDGGPSDAWITPAKDVHVRHDMGRMTMIAVGFGPNVHTDKLKRVTPMVILSDSTEPQAFAKFLQWASTSVSQSCQVVSSGAGASQALPPLPPDSGLRFLP